MTENIKHRHHYVWKHYLNAWTDTKNKIWLYQKGNYLNTTTNNVALVNDFYAIRELSQADINFIILTEIDGTNKDLRQLQFEWLSFFTFPQSRKNLYEEIGTKDLQSSASFLKIHKEMIFNSMENIHDKIESFSTPILDALLKGNTDFLQTEDTCWLFFVYMCMQYLRTNRMEQEILHKSRQLQTFGADISKCWPVMRNIYATNIAYTLFNKRASLAITILNNNTQTEFITSDQPVINIFSVLLNGARSLKEHELELYYPVSPKRAIIISKTSEKIASKNVTDQDAFLYNKLIAKASHEQIYANSENALTSIAQFHQMKPTAHS